MSFVTLPRISVPVKGRLRPLCATQPAVREWDVIEYNNGERTRFGWVSQVRYLSQLTLEQRTLVRFQKGSWLWIH